jgi:hypothetical protein
MKILVDRYLTDGRSTLSKIYVDGHFICYGLEDEHRDIKVQGETRIPAGTYKVTVRTVGGFHNRYSQDARFEKFHRGMLWVRDVPGFEYILIHVGNTEKHTEGCLLVGSGARETPGSFFIGNSAMAYKTLYEMVIDAAECDDLTITYVDNDKRV